MPDIYKMERFKRAVLTDAQKEHDKMCEKIREKRKSRIFGAENLILDDTFQYVQEQTARIRSKYGKRLSSHSAELRKKLMEKRAEIVDGIMDSVRRQTAEYTNTPEYKSHISERLSLCAETLGKENLTLRARPRDIALVTDIVKEMGFSVTINEDPQILLGGFVLSSDGIQMNETFDQRLADELAAFSKNSELALDI